MLSSSIFVSIAATKPTATKTNGIKQASLNELHKLNITLANYFDILPDVLNGSTISKPSQESVKEESQQQQIILV